METLRSRLRDGLAQGDPLIPMWHLDRGPVIPDIGIIGMVTLYCTVIPDVPSVPITVSAG